VCKQPVKASRDTCTAKKAQILGEACGRQLAKDCHAAGMGFVSKTKECDAVQASKQVCTSTGLRAVFASKPQCILKLKEMCKKQPKDTAPIPAGCVKWFDGCNYCSVQSNKATGCTKKFCHKPSRPFCAEFQDKRACRVSKVTRKVVCKKPGAAVTKAPAKRRTCDDITSDLALSDEETCRQALQQCAGKPEILRECKTKMEDKEKARCKTERLDSRKAKCCVEGKLGGAACKTYGNRTTLPQDCKTRCFSNGKFKQDAKECVRCRGKDGLRATAGKTGDKADKRPFDPARVKQTIKEIASGLDKAGKTCVERIANATASLKARLTRWRQNKPTQKQEAREDTETKSLAEVQAEVEETVNASKSIEDEFEADAEGKAYREKAGNEDKRLKNKISDSSKPKTQQCRAAFDALRDRFNAVVDKYSTLPATLKAKGVKRVKFSFADTDIGRTDLKSSKSVCKFASKYVTQLKNAETNHKKRLAAARTLLCTDTGNILDKKLISNLSNCLRKAKREAQGADAKRDADADATQFDANTRKHVQKLLSLMKKKCLKKDGADSELSAPTDLFRETLTTRVKKKTGQLTGDDRKNIAKRVNDAVQKKYPHATNIVTTMTDSQRRRRLRDRRELSAAVDVQTTWQAPDAPTAGDGTDLGTALGAEFQSSALQITSQPTPGSLEGADSVGKLIQNIDAQLPVDGSATTAVANSGATQTVWAGATLMCTTLLAMTM